MLWAQWVYLVLVVSASFAGLAGAAIRVERDVTAKKHGVSGFLIYLITMVPCLALVVLSGAFSKIFGWPS